MRAPEAETLGDHRRTAVRRDHQARGHAFGGGARPRLGGLGDDAGDAAALAEQIDHPDAFADPDADLAGTLDERGVQDPAAHRESVRTIAVPGTAGRVVADEQRAVRREDPHAPEWAGAACLDRPEGSEAIENAASLGREILPAHLVARESRAVDEDDGQSLLGEEDRRRGARGTGADDDRVSRTRAAPESGRVQTPI